MTPREKMDAAVIRLLAFVICLVFFVALGTTQSVNVFLLGMGALVIGILVGLAIMYAEGRN